MMKQDAQADLIVLGQIVSVYGLKGWVKVKTYTQDPADLVSYGPLYTTAGLALDLHIQRIQAPNLVLATLTGCHDRNQAEALVGTQLGVKRHQLPVPSQDEFYYHDLVGMTVYDDKEVVIGIVQQVENYGGGDFLSIVGNNGLTYTVPFNKDAVTSVRVEDRVINILRNFLL